MKLYLDTSSNQKTLVRLGDKELVRGSSVWRSQVTLPMIEELLAGRSLTVITEIEYQGSGSSSTGIRVGATIAQTLGYSLQIPVRML